MSTSPSPLERAMAAHQRGDWGEAERLYGDILAAEPRHAGALHLYGLLAHQRGEHAVAVERVERAIGIDGAEPAYHYNLGEIHRTSGSPHAAELAYREALARRPRHASARDGLGLVLYELGRAAEAIPEFEEAARLAPEDAAVRCHLGIACRAAGRLEAALDAFSEACRLDPGRVEAQLRRGDVALELGDLALAETCYETALAHEPESAPALRRLGDLHDLRGDPERARSRFEALLRLDPEDASGWRGMGNALIDGGRVEEGVKALESALALDRSSAAAWSDLGTARLIEGDASEAERAFERALALDPTYTAAYENLARCRKFDESDAARIDALAALEAAGSLPIEARISLGFALGKMHEDCARFERAFECYARANALKRSLVSFDPRRYEGLVERIAGSFGSLPRDGVSSARPVFIVGMPRSGTTLVEQILASHPAVHGGGELALIDELSREMAVVVGAERPYPESVARLSGPSVVELAERYLARLDALDVTASRVTDKMPSNFLHLGLIRRLFPEARIIHCRREALDVCTSNYFQHFAHGNAWSYDLADIAVFYRGYRRLMAHWRALGVETLEVDYEQLVAEPKALSRRLVEHCGLEWHEACERFYESTRAVRTAANWQVRQPVYRSSLGRWRPYRERLTELRAALELERER